MSYKKLFIFSAVFALVGGSLVGSSVFARGVENEQQPRVENSSRQQQSHVEDEQSTRDDQASHDDSMMSEQSPGMENDRSEMDDRQKQRVEDHKTELKDRFAEQKEKRTEKLESKRLETCQKRQDKINSIGTKSTEQNKKHLAVFQKIEQNVKNFYVSKNLSAEGYDAAVAAADEKEAIAVANVETSAEVSFDCATTDGAKPGSAIKELMTSRHAALKEYRTAIKNLIQVVKKAHSDSKPTTEPAKPETNTGEEQ